MIKLLFVFISVLLYADGFNISSYVNLKNCDKVLNNKYYKVCYSYKYNGALAVWYALYGNKVNKTNIKKRPGFRGDKKLPRSHRVYNSDYVGSGYDKGHCAFDAGNDYSKASLRSTYLLSNIVPQKHSINAGAIATGEQEAINDAVKYGTVYVVDIIDYTYSDDVIGKRHKIVVPSTFIKLIINKNGNLIKRVLVRQPI